MAPGFRSAPIANDSARSLLFALLGSERFPGGGQTLSRAWPSAAAQDAAFASLLAEGSGSQNLASPTRLLATSSSPIFAAQPLPEPDDTLLDLPLFTDPVQDSQGDGDAIANFFTADPDSLYD